MAVDRLPEVKPNHTLEVRVKRNDFGWGYTVNFV